VQRSKYSFIRLGAETPFVQACISSMAAQNTELSVQHLFVGSNLCCLILSGSVSNWHLCSRLILPKIKRIREGCPRD